MSKYKVGDKFVIEINSEYFDNYKIKETDLILSDYTLNKLQKYEGDIASKTYEDGLNDAWELARKICGDGNNKENYDGKTIGEIFGGYIHSGLVLDDFTYQQALAKIEAYEKSQQIQVGDVVYADDEPDSFGVVTWKYNNGVYVMWDDGSCGDETNIEELHKTGRHIDIEHLLEQIRGNE